MEPLTSTLAKACCLCPSHPKPWLSGAESWLILVSVMVVGLTGNLKVIGPTLVNCWYIVLCWSRLFVLLFHFCGDLHCGFGKQVCSWVEYLVLYCFLWLTTCQLTLFDYLWNCKQTLKCFPWNMSNKSSFQSVGKIYHIPCGPPNVTSLHIVLLTFHIAYIHKITHRILSDLPHSKNWNVSLKWITFTTCTNWQTFSLRWALIRRFYWLGINLYILCITFIIITP